MNEDFPADPAPTDLLLHVPLLSLCFIEKVAKGSFAQNSAFHHFNVAIPMSVFLVRKEFSSLKRDGFGLFFFFFFLVLDLSKL